MARSGLLLPVLCQDQYIVGLSVYLGQHLSSDALLLRRNQMIDYVVDLLLADGPEVIFQIPAVVFGHIMCERRVWDLLVNTDDCAIFFH